MCRRPLAAIGLFDGDLALPDQDGEPGGLVMDAPGKRFGRARHGFRTRRQHALPEIG
ncbi:protein of unknown function (plasmid) [Cupriavidus taiwanensis]|nr:protein of unknown function [Cupriavidus taiwanensis]